jgi:hypothetical protein
MPRTDFERHCGLNQRAPSCLSRVRVALVPLPRLLLFLVFSSGGGARGAGVSIFKPGEEWKRNVDGFCSAGKFLENTTLGGARALGTGRVGWG